MSYRFDYREPLSSVIERMGKEHFDFKSKLARIQRTADSGNVPVALSLLTVLKTEVLRHAVEEEAILARVIMKNAKKESGESVSVLQAHRTITHFFNDVLPTLQNMEEMEARRKIVEFASFLMKHHDDEERIVFPLAVGQNISRDANETATKACKHLEVTEFRSCLVKDLSGKCGKVMLQQCSCGAYLTMDGVEIPVARIEEFKG
ncbi:MAG: hemerythrin domain-containing protein [Nitrososphaerales archaeon]